MRKAIVIISEEGRSIADIIACEEGCTILSLHDTAKEWKHFDAFIFVAAMGICVRTIAPLLDNKHDDPAVLCVDTKGKHVIPVVSGHVGGANVLALEVAHILGATPVITTRSDNEGLWQLDTLAGKFGWVSADKNMNSQIAIFVERRPTALLLGIRDNGTWWMECNLPSHVTVFTNISDINQKDFELMIIVSPQLPKEICLPFVWYSPQCLHAGIGLARQAALTALDEINVEITGRRFMPGAIASYNTIDEKRNEPVVARLQAEGKTLRFFSSEQLKTVGVPNPSAIVEKYMSTKSVSEASALTASGNGPLLLEKVKGTQWTLAIALDSKYERRGHVEIVGAGPGDPELISVRGRQFLEQADLILYAGSLVPRELTDCAKAGATIRSSASMALEEQCQLMKSFCDRGLLVVRLHTGDPCIFGAIQEQMAFFDANGIDYHITPGISSFLAAAAELRSQFTIPERCQTIILTRGEGRTPMPDREKLHLLARSRSTMCIFLSAAIVDDVETQLLTEYPEDTPVAVCHHLTWRDQRIYRGKLRDLANIVHDNGLTLTTMIVVGNAIDNRHGNSELYNSHFTHLFRKGK